MQSQGNSRSSTSKDEDILRLLAATHHDPHTVLGPRRHAGTASVLALLPGASEVCLEPGHHPCERIRAEGLFLWEGPVGSLPDVYRLSWTDQWGRRQERADPYAFSGLLDDTALQSFACGTHHRAWNLLGARVTDVQGVPGTLFSVWAPNASRVSVVGDFNHWDGRCHPMRVCGEAGVWELFVPGIGEGALYKFEIRSRASGELRIKTDPYGRRFEVRPGTAAIVVGPGVYQWGDADWLARRGRWRDAPVSVYEVHLGSWLRHADGGFLNYRELSGELLPYVLELGFTHIELLPITEHPLDASWGYQTTGYFAPTSRHGSADDFRAFVDDCHRAGIGVYLDWVPGHFPRDEFALARFDGTALYEHHDPRIAEHPDWGTLVFNFGRNEVRSFLISSALFWLEEMHLDGLRVDAVASMLYLDYSRKPGEWVPNRHGGNENLDAIAFLCELNTVTHREHPGTVTIAEESTAWPQVSRPTYVGGLGFSMKWNLGWMHDTLSYLALDPVHRHYHHDRLTFGLLYAFGENFLLPLSHDEVVHGKGSLFGKMAGDEWQKFANLRLLFVYQFCYPGKKLLFMGAEFGNPWEWNCSVALPRFLLEDPARDGLKKLVADLNHLYRTEPALHGREFESAGFAWIDCHDAVQSVISFRRRCNSEEIVVLCNFTPVPREGYRIGVPRAGTWGEVLNSDAACYGGGNVGNCGQLQSEPGPWMGLPHSLAVTIPPLGALVLKLTVDA